MITRTNELLGAAYEIAKREGKETNWEVFRVELLKELEKQSGTPQINEVHIDGVFANKDELGFHIWWKGDKGFGSIRISEHIQNDMWFEVDSENMSREFVEKVLLSLLVGSYLNEIPKTLPQPPESEGE
jgi:hypothetical protein